MGGYLVFFFFSSRRRHTISLCDWSSDVCSSDLSLVSRSMQGPEEAMRVYREMLGLEGGARERGVDFMAQTARGYGVDASPLFEGVLRFAPTSAARVAAAAYLAENGREETVLSVLESLQPPALT